MSKIAPNNLSLAQQELATISHFENGFEIPKEIDAQASNNHYWIIGVRSSDTADGFSKVYRAKCVCVSINQYNKMQRQIKQGLIKGLFGSTWQKTFILHNPTIKPKKVDKPKGLSPNVKGKIKKLFAEDMSAEDIAAELGSDLALTKAYIEEKLK